MAHIDLATFFGVYDPQKTLAEMGFTVSTAQAKFPAYWKKWKEWNRADADFLLNTFMTAAHEQISWERGSANIHWGAMPGGPGMNGTPLKFNQQLRWPFGEVTGSGLFIASLSDTMAVPDHDRWNGDRKKRNVLVSWSYGVNGLYGYHEGAFLDKIRFWGDKRSKYNDPSYESSGVVLFDAGEGSKIERVKCDYFNSHGLHIERGTPAHISNVSAFLNGLAGVAFVGCEGNSVEMGVLSVDDNLWALAMLSSADREAGGRFNIGLIKLESGTTSEAEWAANGYAQHRYTGQPIICRGLFNLNIGMLSYASTHIRSAQLFWVDPRLKNGTPVASRIECRGIGKGAPPNAGFAALLVDSRLGTWYEAPPPETAWHMVYTTIDGVLRLNGEVVQPSGIFPKGAGPMSFARPGETLNFAAGTPQQQVTSTAPIPPPVTCTWVEQAGAWSACNNGTQSRTITYVPSVDGCTPTMPKPADRTETQPCTMPPTGSVIETVSNFSNASATYGVAKAWAGSHIFVFTSLKPLALNYQMICNNGSKGIVVLPNGSMVLNTSGGDEVLLPAGTLKVGVAWSGTITLPRAVDFTRMGALPNAGNAFLGSWTKLEVKR